MYSNVIVYIPDLSKRKYTDLCFKRTTRRQLGLKLEKWGSTVVPVADRPPCLLLASEGTEVYTTEGAPLCNGARVAVVLDNDEAALPVTGTLRALMEDVKGVSTLVSSWDAAACLFIEDSMRTCSGNPVGLASCVPPAYVAGQQP